MKKNNSEITDSTIISEQCAGQTFSTRFYYHGAHAGNIRYEIEVWGMNSPVREAAIKRKLDDFISDLQVDWQGL